MCVHKTHGYIDQSFTVLKNQLTFIVSNGYDDNIPAKPIFKEYFIVSLC